MGENRPIIRVARVCFAVVCFATLLVPVGAQSKHGIDGYTLGVFPFVPPLRLERMFGPVVRSLNEALPMPIQFRTRSSFKEFAADLEREIYDIAFVHGFD